MVHHPAHRGQMQRCVVRKAAIGILAGRELVADPGDGLQHGVVQIAGQSAPLPQGRLEFDGRFPTGLDLGGQERRLDLHLPAEQHRPCQRCGQHQRHNRQRGGQTGGRPPRRPPDHDDVLRGRNE